MNVFKSEGFSDLAYYQVCTTFPTAIDNFNSTARGEILAKRAIYYLHEICMDNYEITHFLDKKENNIILFYHCVPSY